MAERILPGYEQQIQDQQPMKLKKRRSSWVKKLIIALIIIVVVLGGLVLAALLVGDHLCRENLGVSMWTMFDVMGDLKKNDKKEIVTNAYTDSDVDGFYANINSNLFLKESAGTKEIVDGLMSGMISGGGVSTESLQDDALALFNYENININKLYEQTRTDATQHLQPYTDRQFAAFFDEMIFSAIDEMIFSAIDEMMGDSMPFGLSLGDFAQKIDQLIIANGVDVDDYYKPNSSHVYMTMTATMDLYKLVDQMFDDMNVDTGGFMWLIHWLMPETIYFTMTFDIDDPTYAPVYEINHLDRYTCNYKAVGADEAVEMTKQDRMFEAINAMARKLGSDSQFEVRDTMDGLMTDIESFISKSEDADFSLGNYIQSNSVKKTSAGNEFKIDLLGSMMSMIGSGLDLDTTDVITLMQAVMCPDTDDILNKALGADVYEVTGTGGQAKITTSSYMMYEEEKPGGGAFNDIDEDTMRSFMDKYNEKFLEQLAEDYGVEIKTVNEGETEYLYTIEDLYGALGLGEPTEKSNELLNEIETKIEQKEIETGEAPSIKVDDEMLCALMYSKLDGSDTDLKEYGVTFRKLGIENKPAGADSIARSYAKIYCTFNFNSLVDEDSMVGDLIGNLLGGKKMLLEIIVDVTILGAGEDRDDPVLVINGLNGKTLNGLKTEDVTKILGDISSFDINDLTGNLNGLTGEAVGSISTSPLVGIKYIDSPVDRNA